jgi:hypothetical protein
MRSLRSLHENRASALRIFDTFGKTTFATLSSQQRTFTRMRAASGLCPQADMELPLETLPNPTRAAKVIDTDSWLRVGGQA